METQQEREPGNLPPVQELTTLTPVDLDVYMNLYEQLSPHQQFDREELGAELMAAIEAPHVNVLVIRATDGRIEASQMAAFVPLGSGAKGWIEDVVTDEEGRGKGHGQRLLEAQLAWCQSMGAKTVNLHSGAHREAAGRLYERNGFEQKATRVFALDVGAIALNET